MRELAMDDEVASRHRRSAMRSHNVGLVTSYASSAEQKPQQRGK
jgi:hypothetical protein